MHWPDLRILGKGRVGTVYEWTDPKTGTAYALKRVGPEGIAQLEQGFAVQHPLRHPGILRAHRSERDDEGGGYSVLDLADGEVNGPLSLEDLHEVLYSVGSALSYLHQRGWVHRDVKPGNLLRRNAAVVLSDFGLAHPVGTEGLVAPVGTPPYMPAECFLQWQTGPAVDWFALGVTLFELLTGELPYEAESLQDELLAKQQGCYARHRLPDAVVPLFDGLLDPDPQGRWHFAQISQYLRHFSVAA